MKIAFLGNFGVDFSSESHHAKSLEALGHQVVRMQENEMPWPFIEKSAEGCDMFVWVHTHGWKNPQEEYMPGIIQKLKDRGVPIVAYHLDLWFGIARQADLEGDPYYRLLDHFFTCDKLMAEWFTENTDVKGHYLPAGVFGEECVALEPLQEPLNDVIFVGSKGYHPEWPWRPQLINWLAETYGDRFQHFGGDGKGVVRGMALNQLYANTKVVVGDSLVIGFDYPWYWSDRVYETIGRGGFLLMPEIKGLVPGEFTSEELETFKFGDFADLKKKIDFYIKNDLYRNVMRQRAFTQVKNNYTYKHRWQTILTEVGL